MKTTDFNAKISSSALVENMNKMFGVNVNLNKYSREQLEDMRNKLRTRVFQQEGQAGINDLLTNETYQKDKAMLALLNTRIKEMLGEDIKKLKDKLAQLDEAKKGVRAPKHKIHAQGTAAKDYDGDGKKESPKDEVWGSRAKAAAKSGKPFKEGAKPDFLDMDKDGNKKEPMKKAVKDKKVSEVSQATVKSYKDKADPWNRAKSGDSADALKRYEKGQAAADKRLSKDEKANEGWDDMKKAVADKEKEKGTGKFDVKKTATGTQYTRKSSTFSDGGDDKDVKAAKKKAKSASEGQSHAAKTTMKHVKNPTKGEKQAAKDIKPGIKGYRDRVDMLKSAEKDGRLKEANQIFKQHVRIVNESIAALLAEDEEGKAKAITAAGDIVNDYTSWMQRVGQYQTKSMIELADAIRADFGAAEAEAFKQAVGPALTATLETLTQQREAISNAVASLAGEAPAAGDMMGAEPGADAAFQPEPGMEPAAPDEMNAEPGGDEFGAADAAAGAGTPGREVRESKFARRLAESHSIMAKLAK